ncbi:hypothetical protein KVR01_001163 [Diaporthe batatas]|uniref:uncharacterized protein n=1 Tax=Diaporthe batatas TaxID=748121 RepID=UPI001D059A5B|nr:uncharacterized protein KVR01_001163 [Diaporthe batatas]KAG8168414.1 hypothetical protein KVR01_001163 [Diaporthe batatas]
MTTECGKSKQNDDPIALDDFYLKDPETKMTTGCTRYFMTNACGHVGVTMLGNCSKHLHDNDVRVLHECCLGNEKPGTEVIKIKIGDRYCDRGCEARNTGWRCCTCRKHVEGYVDQHSSLLVHPDGSQDLHAFCPNCLIESEYESKTGSSNADNIVNSVMDSIDIMMDNVSRYDSVIPSDIDKLDNAKMLSKW